MLTEKETRQVKSRFDGRLLRMFVHETSNGLIYAAWFNDDKYDTIITKEQYEKYKPMCTLISGRNTADDIIEHWDCASRDNGLPKWLNNIIE